MQDEVVMLCWTGRRMGSQHQDTVVEGNKKRRKRIEKCRMKW